ncbi:hypothetical protein SK128_007712 [Halocaridina rubra]|uniref:Uncharacterized protein n=1 Tax=Halocaridina rubra TaxID=373956 RepID=A0AAN9A7F8_HALRR
MCSGQEHVAALLSSLKKRSINLSDLTKLPSYQKLLQKRLSLNNENDRKRNTRKRDKVKEYDNKSEISFKNTIKTRGFWYALVIGVLAVAFAMLYQYELHTHQGFARFWLNWENIDLNAEQTRKQKFPSRNSCGACIYNIDRSSVQEDAVLPFTHTSSNILNELAMMA